MARSIVSNSRPPSPSPPWHTLLLYRPRASVDGSRGQTPVPLPHPHFHPNPLLKFEGDLESNSIVFWAHLILFTARGQAGRGRGSNSPRPSRYGPRRFGRRSKDVLYSTFFLFYLCAARPAKASASNCRNQRCNGEKTNVDHQLGHP